MKRIIGGRKYDTGTARELGAWDNGAYGDFDFCSESLYRKKNGEFFLYGRGGARSPYADRRGDRWGSGEAIRPLSVEDARRWAEEHLSANEYEDAFGPAPDGEAVMVAARVSTAARAALDREVERTGRTAASIIDELLVSLSERV